MDISDIDKFKFELFKVMIDKGPLTVYSLSKFSERAHPTVHRHCKELEVKGYIKVYRTEDHRTGQKKKFYGPTLPGIFMFCTLFKEYHQRLDFIVDKWKGEKLFLKELFITGFDLKQLETDPVNFKTIFKKYAKLYSDAWFEVENFEPTDKLRLEVGFYLLSRRNLNKHLKIMKELYQTVPGFKLQTYASFVGMMTLFAFLEDKKFNNPAIDQIVDNMKKEISK